MTGLPCLTIDGAAFQVTVHAPRGFGFRLDGTGDRRVILFYGLDRWVSVEEAWKMGWLSPVPVEPPDWPPGAVLVDSTDLWTVLSAAGARAAVPADPFNRLLEAARTPLRDTAIEQAEDPQVRGHGAFTMNTVLADLEDALSRLRAKLAEG